MPERAPDEEVRVARPGLWPRLISAVRENFVEPLVASKHPPWYDARGVSVGLIIGFVVPVGGQLVSLGLLRALLRFNFVVAAGFTLVSNPLNMVPLYYGYYCLGSWVLGRPIGMNLEVFSRLMNPIMDRAYFWEALADFFTLSQEFLLRWCVAAVILAVVFGVIGYVATLKIQHARCRKAARKMGLRYEKLIEELERNARSSNP